MLVKFAVRNLFRNRRRSLVAIGTVAVGIFGLLFLRSFFAGLMALHTENSVHSRYGHGQVMTAGYWDQTFEEPWTQWMDDAARLEDSLRNAPGVAQVFPRVQFFGLLQFGQVSVAGRGQGIDGVREKDFFDKLNFIDGGPIADHANGVVLGKGLAKSLGVGVGDSILVLGQTVRGTLNAIEAEVTGVFYIGMKEADDVLFQVQLAQAQSLLDTDKVESFAIALQDGANWEDLKSWVNDEWSNLDALSVIELDEAWAKNGDLFLRALLNVFQFTFLGMILLAIYNSASNAVLERKREIGMLRANGESMSYLSLQVAGEGLLLGLIGAGIGCAGLLIVATLYQGGFPMPPTPGTSRELPVTLLITMQGVGFGMGLGILATTAASLFSILQMKRLSIVAAIRSY